MILNKLILTCFFTLIVQMGIPKMVVAEGLQPPSPIAGVNDLSLSVEEIVKLKDAEKNGDGDASLRLGMHYDFIKLDNEQAILHYKNGARAGNSKAMVFLSLILVRDSNTKQEGILWLQEAAKLGNTNAIGILEEYK